MKNSPKLKSALSLLVLSGTCLPLASVAGVWDYDNVKSVEQPAAEAAAPKSVEQPAAEAAAPKSVEQPAAEAAAPRSGLEGPIRTETMEPARSEDAGTIYELGQIQQSPAEASPGKHGAAGPVGKETAEFPYP
jgi:hypothetical protein